MTTVAFILSTIAIIFLLSIVFQDERKEKELKLELKSTRQNLEAQIVLADKIKRELAMNVLTKEQMLLIKRLQSSMKKSKDTNTLGLVDQELKIDWKQIKFLVRIGSGSFGDTVSRASLA